MSVSEERSETSYRNLAPCINSSPFSNANERSLSQVTIFQRQNQRSLLVILRGLVADDGEVSHLVRALVAGDHVQVVSELLLLQVLLSQVLQVPLGEGGLSRHRDACLRWKRLINHALGYRAFSRPLTLLPMFAGCSWIIIVWLELL